MMKRPQEFPNLGKTYKIEWVQFQGTAPMVQAMLAGALDCATMAPLSLAQGHIKTASTPTSWRSTSASVPARSRCIGQ